MFLSEVFHLLSSTRISAGRSAHTTSLGRGFVGDVGEIRSEFSLDSESVSHDNCEKRREWVIVMLDTLKSNDLGAFFRFPYKSMIIYIFYCHLVTEITNNQSGACVFRLVPVLIIKV